MSLACEKKPENTTQAKKKKVLWGNPSEHRDNVQTPDRKAPTWNQTQDPVPTTASVQLY